MNNSVDNAIWVAKQLFSRNKVSGSTANLSLIIDNKMYITGTGSCFGLLDKDKFSIYENGINITNIKPSKEIELHRIMYSSNKTIKAVIHTHSTYSTYYSCISDESDEYFKNPSPTPYLDILVGKVGIIGYEKPGSDELFDLLRKESEKKYMAYLMKNHGIIVGGKNIMDAFFKLEEIEESCRIGYMISSSEKI